MADPGGASTPKSAIIFQFFAENCMKMKEFGPPGEAGVLGAPLGIRHCGRLEFFPSVQNPIIVKLSTNPTNYYLTNQLFYTAVRES